MKKILVTGGTGFIGSHTLVELIEYGYDVVVLDNLINSSVQVLDRVEQITGVYPKFVQADIRDYESLTQLFSSTKFYAVIHFAGLKAVGESVRDPLLYYQYNVFGSLQLLKAMAEFGCQRLVFSSSATVYGNPESVPIAENAALSVTNPYGRSKLIIEEILKDLSVADKSWQISILRYFNPIAAHPSGLIGEDPKGTPNNLLPYIAQVAMGKLAILPVYGDDYETRDGTGVRDYIHVVDLAQAHIKALQSLTEGVGCRAHNIGTGFGYSVYEIIKAFELVSGIEIPFSVKQRRSGDIPQCYADPSLSEVELGWKAKYDLNKMMEDQWRWQSHHPDGYQD